MKLTRRNFLKAIVVTAGTIEACSSDADSGTTVDDGQRFFPQSLASGDPRPDSVVLWTRALDSVSPSTDFRVTLEVATDSTFAAIVVRKGDLVASASHDHAIKVKVTSLTARTVYYYRFVYEQGERRFASKTGRTKTAPAASDDTPLKFAVTTCQDFVGRYYNSWQYLTSLDLDLDFVIFLGDYVYETTGDPRFQTPGPRDVVLTDPDSALVLGSPGSTYLAAQSVSNYRDLYKSVRSDAFLRAAHERYPFVFIWDDHEYSDDCYGANSNYSDGKMDETMVERRRNGEQAFFEYVPLDHPNANDTVYDVDAIPKYPETRIYRDLAMGKNLRLLVADYRTYRPDHVIPEDAFPATVIMTSDVLAAAKLDTVFSSDTFAYVDIDSPEYALQKGLLRLAYQQLAAGAGLDANMASARAMAAVTGPLALAYVNAVLTNPLIGALPIDPAGKPRGLAWVHMGKRDLFSNQGARYVIVKDTFDAYTAYKYATTQGASENVYGDAQTAWLTTALAAPETWKVLVSSVSLTSLVIDLRDKLDVTDETLRNRFYLNCDQWDGFPNRRRDLLRQLAATQGGKAFAVSGDIHAAFASVEEGVVCLTTPAISSAAVKAEAGNVAVGAGFDETSAIYKYVVTEIDASFRAGNAGITFSECNSHGFLVVDLRADSATAAYYLIPASDVSIDYAEHPAELPARFVKKTFQLAPGSIAPG